MTDENPNAGLAALAQRWAEKDFAAAHWLRRISVREPKRWAHWEIGVRVAVP